MPRVRAYVAEVCAPALTEEAAAAAFVEFLARAPAEPADELELDHILLEATRSAAAGRFAVAVPMGHPELALTADCRAMPELLALHANGERHSDEGLIGAHLVSCAICAHTLDRMQRAERAFAQAAGELPALEIEETVVDTSKARPGPGPPAAQAKPRPEPETFPRPAAAGPATAPAQPPVTHRRRSGGLVGAIRNLARAGRG